MTQFEILFLSELTLHTAIDFYYCYYTLKNSLSLLYVKGFKLCHIYTVLFTYCSS